MFERNLNAIKTSALILALALLSFSVDAFAGSNSSLKVTVTDQAGNPIPGAGVGAIFFNNGQPDPVASQLVLATDVNGQALFTPQNGNALVDGDQYIVVADTQGYLPNMVGQFNNGAPSIIAQSGSTQTVAIVLTKTSGLGEIDVNVNNASTGTLVFGQIGLQAGGGNVNYAVALIVAGTVANGGAGVGGVGTLRFHNIAFAAANTYEISAYAPNQNRCPSAQVGTALNSGNTPLTLGAPLVFLNAAQPITNLSQTQQNGSGGGLSVSGVIIDTTTAANPVPYAQINLAGQYTDPYGQTQNDWRGNNSDQNGNFQFYGLLAGVTYFMSVNGACNNNTCYAGFQDAIGSFTANDFLYPSSTTVLNRTVKLSQAAPSTGRLAVYVKDQFGNPFPQAGMGLWGDGTYWGTAGGVSCNPRVSNPGYVNLNNIQAATNYALLSGLSSGNYNLNVWTPYGSVNFNSPNGGSQGSCPPSGGPFYRLTIDTTQATNDAALFDTYGNQIGTNISSVTVVVNVSTSNTGAVQGTLTFPSQVDLSANPILITLYVNCSGGGNCPNGGGYKVLNSATQPASATYSIPVSSGLSYWMEIQSSYWGAVYPGGQQPQPNLTLSSYSVVNLQFMPAGRVLGVLRKPDGSAYVVPSNNNGNTPSVDAEGNRSWGFTQINNDGSFTIGGLLPGVYTLDAANWGGASFPYTTQLPAPTVTIVANQDTRQDLPLSNAVTVRPLIRPTANPTSVLPGLAIANCPNSGSGDCPGEDWKVVPLLAGTPFSNSTVNPLLAHSGGHNLDFDFSSSTGNSSHCNNSQYLTQPGFCPRGIPAQPAGTSYDLYVMRRGAFDQMGTAIGGAARPYFVIEYSSKSIIVSPTSTNNQVWNGQYGFSSATTTVQDVDLTPAASMASLPEAVLAGTVTISNLITQQEFQNLGGDFNKFLQYIPVVYLYDSSGTLKAAGMVVPFPPAETVVDTQLNQAVQSGNFAGFQALMNPQTGWGPVGYEIRGLTAGTTYNLVVQTPNYPPYKATVALGPAQSTTTFNINLDLNQGATLSGVVTSTNGVALSGANVTITASGYGPTALTTNGSGQWSVGGLAAGQYTVNVVAAGYVQGAALVSVGGSGSVTAPTISLALAGASISGNVFTNNPICPAGSICAAFGKTALAGITVAAFDDTLSGLNPSAILPLYKGVTDSSGNFTLSGLQVGDAYTVYVKAPGYFVTNQTTTTIAGANLGLNFSLKPKPLDVDVFGSPAGAYYEFQIHNFKSFSSGRAWIGLTTGFSTNTATEVTASFNQKPDARGVTQLILDYPLSSLASGVSYTLEIIAQPNDPTAPPVIKILQFGLNISNNACQRVDEKLLGDNSSDITGLPSNLAALDASGNNGSGLELPVGGIIPVASTAVPSACMSQTDASASVYGTVQGSSQAFLSGVYQISLASANYNQGINLTLSYNQSKTNLNDAAIYHLNNQTGQWESIPGIQTLDPVRGTISIKGLKGLASVLSLGQPKSGAPMDSSTRFIALFNGHQHSINPMSLSAQGLRPDDLGVFAILSPSQVGGSFTGTQVKIYNFPNPFNLQTKSVPINLSGSNACGTGGLVSPVTVLGTLIKVESPSGISGQAALRIYTLSGRLVRELDAGVLNGTGQCIYLPWDGLNRTGQQVADGVYYGIFTVNGNKNGGANGVVKMAVVK